MEYALKTEGDFRYIETKGGEETLVLLHGLFGALSNFKGLLDYFGKKYNVVVPMLPIYDLPLRKVSLKGLVQHVAAFVRFKGFEKIHVLGNSLGGHLALLFSLEFPDKVASLILTGSSGLFEKAMGSSFPKRGNYEYIKKKTEETFYDPKVATKELVDEVFEIVNNRNKAIRVIAMAKSAIRNNLENQLHKIKAPTLLIWGKQDNITPPFVAEQFHKFIPQSKLVFLDHCGHAPMMEHPQAFAREVENFLEELKKPKKA